MSGESVTVFAIGRHAPQNKAKAQAMARDRREVRRF
jgi:hypothetical protein